MNPQIGGFVREIRFRAWNTTHAIQGEEMEYCTLSKIADYHIPMYHTCMQFIGLRDVNDRIIFESDIVKFMDVDSVGGECEAFTNKGVVTWDVESAGFTISNMRTLKQDEIMWDEVEVIGNIYENPDRLKENSHD